MTLDGGRSESQRAPRLGGTGLKLRIVGAALAGPGRIWRLGPWRVLTELNCASMSAAVKLRGSISQEEVA
ncbi:MAG: hypothetical protein QOD24_4472 [Solirubrobacteraceae bacterium]|jgi:hypothetical protein|nr:hypothetical protein [Solirubrobacteraceae bacterium]